MLIILRHLRDCAESCKWLTEVIIHGDSQLVIYQMNGKYKVKEKLLKPLWLEAINLVHVLKEEYGIVVKFRWVRRALNNAALGITCKTTPEDIDGGAPDISTTS
jgi:ribonuclease HI